jgi:hypothetical protein
MKSLRSHAFAATTFLDSMRSRNHASISRDNHAGTRNRYPPNLRSHSPSEVRRPTSNSWLAKIVLLLWLVSSIFVIFAVSRIDNMVNRQLYNFGLRFSYEWATPYWIFMWTIFVCIALPGAASIGLLLLDVWRRFAPRKDLSLKSTNQLVPVTCPSCKKSFSNTLTMYDFSTGKAELIKTCPFCNTVLKDEHCA